MKKEGEHMAKDDNNTLIKVKDPKGNKYLCPIDTNPGSGFKTSDQVQGKASRGF